MVYQIRHFVVTVPAGTPQGSPQITDITIPVQRLMRVEWHLPPGCAGLVGFLLSMGGVPVQPLPAGTYVTGDSRHGSWQLADQPDSGKWQITAYNTGANPHAVHIDLHTEPIIRAEAPLLLLTDVELSHYSTQFDLAYD